MNTKTCCRCKDEKPLDDFYVICGQREGKCKTCRKEVNKAYYEKNIRKIKEYQKKYQKESSRFLSKQRKVRKGGHS